MSNFSYLSTRPEYSLFANSAIEAEKVFSTSPAMCAVGCRKALELAVKWVYAADKTITMPYKDNLQSLLHEPSFRFAVDRDVWSVLPSIVKAGNLAVHTGHSVSAAVKLRLCWFCCLLAVYAAERLSTCLRRASSSASFWVSRLSCSRIFFSLSLIHI